MTAFTWKAKYHLSSFVDIRIEKDGVGFLELMLLYHILLRSFPWEIMENREECYKTRVCERAVVSHSSHQMLEQKLPCSWIISCYLYKRMNEKS